ncbi:MAG: hypothetical protein V3W34_07365 [Phycisphaerae bacterium]
MPGTERKGTEGRRDEGTEGNPQSPIRNPQSAIRNPQSPIRRAAAIYVLTLMIAMIVTATATTLLALQMANRRLHRNLGDALQAEYIAYAGLDWALGKYQNDPSWRSTAVSGADIVLNLIDGIGTNVTITDPTNDFTDNDTEPVALAISSDANGALFSFTAGLDPAPHEALGYAIYASGTVTFSKVATVRGPIYSDQGFTAFLGVNNLDNGGFRMLETGSVFGTVPNLTIVPSAGPHLTPNLEFYISRATQLASAGIDFDLIDARVSSSSSTEGGANGEGVYHIDAEGAKVKLRNVYLKGTLIITNTAGNDVEIVDGCRMEPGAAGYPTLLVACWPGSLTIAPVMPLDEAGRGVDFNDDGDTQDVIPSAFFGVIWTDAPVTTLGGDGVPYTGSIIAGDVNVVDAVVIDDDPNLAGRLMHGFTDGKLHLRRGSIRATTP